MKIAEIQEMTTPHIITNTNRVHECRSQIQYFTEELKKAADKVTLLADPYKIKEACDLIERSKPTGDGYTYIFIGNGEIILYNEKSGIDLAHYIYYWDALKMKPEDIWKEVESDLNQILEREKE